MRILASHVGYESNGPKRAVIQVEEGVLPRACGLLDAVTDRAVLNAAVGPCRPVPGWKKGAFATVDFSAHVTPGRHILEAVCGRARETVRSAPFEIGPGLVRRKTLSDVLAYFKTQRCSGKLDRADHAVTFFGGREGTVDVHGGWYDASGDVSKYLSHLSSAGTMNPQQTPMVVWNLLEGIERLEGTDAALAAALRERMREEALHGADFLVRMQDTEGYFYTTVFDGWSKDPGKRRICSFSTQQGILSADYRAGFRSGGGVAIAALARAATAGLSGDFEPAVYLRTAESGFAFLARNNTTCLNDGRENIIDDYCALLAASELFLATGSPSYRDAAERRAEGLMARLSGGEGAAGWWRADDGGELPYFHAAEAGLPAIALMRFREAVPSGPLAPAAAERAAASLGFELALTAEVHNPFGLARQRVKPVGGPPRSAFFIPHANPTGYWWQGENARLASLAAAARMARALPGVKGTPRAAELARYAAAQIDWILGTNPFDVCMLDGHGRNNPEYELAWPNYPGGIVNGVTSGLADEDDVDFLPDGPGTDPLHRWRWSEQWIPHAAWFLLAVSMDAEG